MSEHNPNAWQDGFDAWQNGYDDAFYDGIDTSSEMPCKCEACMKAYYEGQGSAMKEISSGWQPAQQSRAADAIRLCKCGKPTHFGNSECFECFAGGRGE